MSDTPRQEPALLPHLLEIKGVLGRVEQTVVDLKERDQEQREELKAHSKRIHTLERFRAWSIGAATACGALAGSVAEPFKHLIK